MLSSINEPEEPGPMSLTRTVPASVPSDFHELAPVRAVVGKEVELVIQDRAARRGWNSTRPAGYPSRAPARCCLQRTRAPPLGGRLRRKEKPSADGADHEERDVGRLEVSALGEGADVPPEDHNSVPSTPLSAESKDAHSRRPSRSSPMPCPLLGRMSLTSTVPSSVPSVFAEFNAV